MIVLLMVSAAFFPLSAGPGSPYRPPGACYTCSQDWVCLLVQATVSKLLPKLAEHDMLAMQQHSALLAVQVVLDCTCCVRVHLC